jgi:sulfur-oxidizing protein SoxX
MALRTQLLFGLVTAASIACAGTGEGSVGAGYCQWQAEDFRIAEALCGLKGDPNRGRATTRSAKAGNCLACHQLPIPGEEFQGTIGPSLAAVGARLSAAELRLRLVDEHRINPRSVMPGFYRNPRLANRVDTQHWGKTILSAQQIEDLVAYLARMR